MADLVVPPEERPSVRKYVGYALVWFALVGGTVTTVLQVSPTVGVITLAVGGITSLASLFVMVQSLIQEWFQAAVIVEE